MVETRSLLVVVNPSPEVVVIAPAAYLLVELCAAQPDRALARSAASSTYRPGSEDAQLVVLVSPRQSARPHDLSGARPTTPVAKPTAELDALAARELNRATTLDW
nr:unnamed protein product [Digitaria exilis]